MGHRSTFNTVLGLSPERLFCRTVILSGTNAVVLEPIHSRYERRCQVGSDIQTRTVEGLMAYCDWLKDKGYQGASATDSWKSAVKMVFETVEPDSFGSISLDGLDVDDYVRRFQTLAGSKYRAETIAVYGRRIKNAIEAQAYYIEHGKPPSFKRGGSRVKADGESPAAETRKPRAKPQTPALTGRGSQVSDDMWDFDYPLTTGRMVHMRLPKRMTKADVDRLSAVLRTLQAEEQAQIPERTGEAIAA